MCALVLTALIVALHVYRATRAGGLWRDEVGTVNTATMPSMPALWASLAHSTPPALPYLVVRLWSVVLALGTSDASLRLLGALEGVGLLLALWIGRFLLGSWVPMLSLALLALNPTILIWGDSPRGYGLGAAWIVLAYGALFRALRAPSGGRVALAAVMAILAVQSVFENTPLLLAFGVAGCVWCLSLGLWRRALLSLGIGALAALTLLPYVPIVTDYRAHDIVVPSAFRFSRVGGRVLAAMGARSAWLTGGWIVAATAAVIGAVRLAMARGRSDREPDPRATLFHV
ncbi:MAG TPA: hypothetical protein VLV15_10105, partial [Dongiaceae bacterium]|nr:hypothetical protein [Dongiaceae bacterium]